MVRLAPNCATDAPSSSSIPTLSWCGTLVSDHGTSTPTAMPNVLTGGGLPARTPRW